MTKITNVFNNEDIKKKQKKNRVGFRSCSKMQSDSSRGYKLLSLNQTENHAFNKLHCMSLIPLTTFSFCLYIVTLPSIFYPQNHLLGLNAIPRLRWTVSAVSREYGVMWSVSSGKRYTLSEVILR